MTKRTSESNAPGRRRPVTLVIRAFENEDGTYYGVVSDPGADQGWQATFSETSELIRLVRGRLDDDSAA